MEGENDMDIVISQKSIGRVLKHLEERRQLLNSLKGKDHSIDLIKMEINAIESTLIGLGIDEKEYLKKNNSYRR